jgi:hypothetical protein
MDSEHLETLLVRLEKSVALFSQSVIALADIEALKLQNQLDTAAGRTPTHTPQDFVEVSSNVLEYFKKIYPGAEEEA